MNTFHNNYNTEIIMLLSLFSKIFTAAFAGIWLCELIAILWNVLSMFKYFVSQCLSLELHVAVITFARLLFRNLWLLIFLAWEGWLVQQSAQDPPFTIIILMAGRQQIHPQ